MLYAPINVKRELGWGVGDRGEARLKGRFHSAAHVCE